VKQAAIQHFAEGFLGMFLVWNVRYGSKADENANLNNVRFTP
jgi:hypothetical protein